MRDEPLSNCCAASIFTDSQGRDCCWSCEKPCYTKDGPDGLPMLLPGEHRCDCGNRVKGQPDEPCECCREIETEMSVAASPALPPIAKPAPAHLTLRQQFVMAYLYGDGPIYRGQG